MSKPVDASTRPNHGEHTEIVPGSRTVANPGGTIRVRRPADQASESTPSTRGQTSATDGKLTEGDITRRARGR
jgi:hypothetical protein